MPRGRLKKKLSHSVVSNESQPPDKEELTEEANPECQTCKRMNRQAEIVSGICMTCKRMNRRQHITLILP